MEKKQSRVTAAQQNLLCSFFEENPEVIRGYKKKQNCIEKVQSKWKKITPRLNALGPPRHHKAWAKYLCDLKAKLKRKRIKWKQKSDGTGPLICNADEFNEIGLRMLQVLRKDAFESQDLQDSESEQIGIYEDNMDAVHYENDINIVVTPSKGKKSKRNETIRIKSKAATSNIEQQEISPEQVPHILTNQNEVNDEFDIFGRNVAQQLRNLPLAIALETQEKLLSTLRVQRLKVLNGTLDMDTNEDPLEKH